MELRDIASAWGAVTGSAALLLHYLKYRAEKPKVVLTCFLARRAWPEGPQGLAYCIAFDATIQGEPEFDPRRAEPCIAYGIKNMGGASVSLTHLGGKRRDGGEFLVQNGVVVADGKPLIFPRELGARQSMTVVVGSLLPVGEVHRFEVQDATGKTWSCKPTTYEKMLRSAQERGLTIPARHP